MRHTQGGAPPQELRLLRPSEANISLKVARSSYSLLGYSKPTEVPGSIVFVFINNQQQRARSQAHATREDGARHWMRFHLLFLFSLLLLLLLTPIEGQRGQRRRMPERPGGKRGAAAKGADYCERHFPNWSAGHARC